MDLRKKNKTGGGSQKEGKLRKKDVLHENLEPEDGQPSGGKAGIFTVNEIPLKKNFGHKQGRGMRVAEGGFLYPRQGGRVRRGVKIALELQTKVHRLDLPVKKIQGRTRKGTGRGGGKTAEACIPGRTL